jgi:hypothetical protein
MTEAELAAIEARADAAAKGPWVVSVGWEIGPPGRPPLAAAKQRVVNGRPLYSPAINAQFIAYAREDVPALIAEVRRLRAMLQERRAELWDTSGQPALITDEPEPEPIAPPQPAAEPPPTTRRSRRSQDTPTVRTPRGAKPPPGEPQ